MNSYIQDRFFRLSVLILTVIPLVLLWSMDNFPERSLLKESFSVITILALYQLLGQFFWTRTNRSVVRNLSMGSVLKYHKVIGYCFAAIMLLHPLFIVTPRFFEAGVSPMDAFITMITTINTGVVLGVIAWFSMVALVTTSFFRRKMPMTYKSWRTLHGILAILFMFAAVWHAIDLGRHFTLLMSLLSGGFTTLGIALVLKTYFLKKLQIR